MHTKNIYKISLVVILLGTLFCSCLRTKDFKINDNLLSDEITNSELQVSYKIPSSFSAVSKNFTDSVSNEEMSRDPAASRICAIYIDTINGASIIVSDMRYVPQEKISKNIKEYKKYFNQNNYWKNVEKERYLHEEYTITEIRCSNDKALLIKLFFFEKDQQLFTVDYSLPATYAEGYKASIESSIGSFKKGYTVIFN